MNLSGFTPEALERIKARRSAKAKSMGLGCKRGRPPKVKPAEGASVAEAAVLKEEPIPKVSRRWGRPTKLREPLRPATPRAAPRPELNGILATFPTTRKLPPWWAQLVEDARNCPPRLMA